MQQLYVILQSVFWWLTLPLEQPSQVVSVVVLAVPDCCVGLYVLQNPHGCTPRPDSYPNSPSEPAYMPLNNFDTIRSYGSAGDELENLPQYSREFVQNISKPNSLYHHHTPQINPLGTPRGSTVGSMVGSTLSSTLGSPGTTNVAADTDSLHKPWKDALAHNLKDTYYENNKIQNGLYFLVCVFSKSVVEDLGISFTTWWYYLLIKLTQNVHINYFYHNYYHYY